MNTSSTHSTSTFTSTPYTFAHTATTFATIHYVEYDEVAHFQGLGK